MMHQRMIDGIMKLVLKKDYSVTSNICEALEEYGKDKMFQVWSVNDIISRAKDIGGEISKKGAMKVIEDLDRHQDATIGINWDVIDDYIIDHKE